MPVSHKRGLLPAVEVDYDFSHEIAVGPEKGTPILCHGNCWHRVTPVTGRYRVSANDRCGPAGTGEEITDVCGYRNMRYGFSTSTVIEDRPGAAQP